MYLGTLSTCSKLVLTYLLGNLVASSHRIVDSAHNLRHHRGDPVRKHVDTWTRDATLLCRIVLYEKPSPALFIVIVPVIGVIENTTFDIATSNNTK